MGRTVRLAGLIALAISAGSTLILVLGHLGAVRVPGCGKESPCAAAAASVWGRLPGIDWPVSFLGLAYFVAALVGWLAVRRGLGTPQRCLVRLGALLSMGFLAVIVLLGYRCPYCLLGHAGNLLFWILVERSPREARRRWQPVLLWAVTFAVVLGVLGFLEGRARRASLEGQEEALAVSTAEIIASSAAATDSLAVQRAETRAWDYPWKGAFRGRYLHGPEKAAIRLVVFTDYQCPDCRRIESEIRRLLRARSDLSLSVRHFPVSSDCNPHISLRQHGNACRAAYAAETAGLLGGDEGFWRMHDWLFDHEGRFTDAQLADALAECGFDLAAFDSVMKTDLPRERVQADITAAEWLGLDHTPMVFVNGVELKGIFTPFAITRAVDQLAAEKLPARAHDGDHPPPATEKYLVDWREGEPLPVSAGRHRWLRGPRQAPVRIVVWGDYQEAETVSALEAIARLLADREDISLSFRYFPLNRLCNPLAPAQELPWACMTAKAAEAAGLLGGGETYWRMHDWLIAHQDDFTEALLADAVTRMGLDHDRFYQVLGEAAIARTIREDCTEAERLKLTSIPMILINERRVARWRRNHESLLHLMVAAAATERRDDQPTGDAAGGHRPGE